MTTCWPFGISPANVITADMVLGPPEGPNKCPICQQPESSWDFDDRGFLFRHAGRAYPCRQVVEP